MIYDSASHNLLFVLLYCISVACCIASLLLHCLVIFRILIGKLCPCHVICAFNILCSSRSLIIIGSVYDCFYEYVLLVVITVYFAAATVIIIK